MDNPSSAGGRKRAPTKNTVEDQALDQIAKEVSLKNLIHVLQDTPHQKSFSSSLKQIKF